MCSLSFRAIVSMPLIFLRCCCCCDSCINILAFISSRFNFFYFFFIRLFILRSFWKWITADGRIIKPDIWNKMVQWFVLKCFTMWNNALKLNQIKYAIFLWIPTLSFMSPHFFFSFFFFNVQNTNTCSQFTNDTVIMKCNEQTIQFLFVVWIDCYAMHIILTRNIK